MPLPRSNKNNRTPWRRKHDGEKDPPVQPEPAETFYPTTLDDLRAIVARAEENGPQQTVEVRASGSHWALSKAAVTNGLAVETQSPESNVPERLNKTLYDVIPACMNTRAMNFFTEQGVGPFNPAAVPDDKIYLYHVEAGTRIYELYSRLDAGDDREPQSLARALGSGPKCDYNGPWAMGTLGGAGGQTIVGAFSTGTHGGDWAIPPIADAVQAIHLVGAGGRHHWIERPLPDGSPLVDAALLGARHPKIEIHRDSSMLAAAVVAVGRMGIIYSVVLRVVRQYALEEARSSDDWSKVKTWLTNTASPVFVNNRFVQVVINPNGQPDKRAEHTCFVTTRIRQPLSAAGTPPFGRQERTGSAAGHSVALGSAGSFTSAVCQSNDWIRAAIDHEINDTNNIRDAALITAGAAIVAAWVPFIDPATRASLLQTAAVALAVAATAKNLLLVLWHILDEVLPPLSDRLGDTLAALANWCAENDHFEILRRASEFAFKNDQGTACKTAASYAVMDVHNYMDVGCSIEGDSIEVFIDAKSPNVIGFVDRLFQRITHLANGALDNGTPRAFGGYLCIRYTKGSFAWLGMQRFDPTASFEVAGLGAIHGTEPFLRTIEADAVEFGAAIHWGQRNNQGMKAIERIWNPSGPFGALFLWRKSLADLSENGRWPTFSTAFTRQRGLEVVQPILADFKVEVTSLPALSKTRVTWDATKNPPDTRVSLVIHFPGSTMPEPEVFVTSELEGFRDVTVPAGPTVFTLSAILSVNGRSLTDERSVDVRGFANHDVWTFELPAQCMTIDGVSRWAAPLSLRSRFISDNLLVEELAGTTTAFAKWRARIAGYPDMSLGPASPAHAFTIPAMFNRDWLFYLEPPGCTGAPPMFHLEFKLVSV